MIPWMTKHRARTTRDAGFFQALGVGVESILALLGIQGMSRPQFMTRERIAWVATHPRSSLAQSN
jgi:hypothetical protein